MEDTRYKYHYAIKIWLDKLMKNTEKDIQEIQQQLYDVEGMQRNLDWLRENLTKMLIEQYKEELSDN